jgi:hypothetical protein
VHPDTKAVQESSQSKSSKAIELRTTLIMESNKKDLQKSEFKSHRCLEPTLIVQRQQEGLTKVRVQKPKMPRINLNNAEAPRRTLSKCRGIKMKTKELKSWLRLRHTLLQRHKKDSKQSKFRAT